MSDTEYYGENDELDDYEDSELDSFIEEEEIDNNTEDILDIDEEENYLDSRLNYKNNFDNFQKVMELSNSDYKSEKKYNTVQKLTKYEKTKILGIRTQQLLSGMPALIDVPKHIKDIKKIAELELEQRKTPLILKRSLPNKNYEYIKIEDLEYI